jgi:DNA helicase-2/ATP-dependent DNA helicase PcrA
MMRRIATLVEHHGIAPEQILGLTFTRNAAEEMRHRLSTILGDIAGRVTLSTIHSFCHWLLRNEGHNFEILSGKDQIIFIKQVMKQVKAKGIAAGMALNEISLSKNNLISHEEFRALYAGDKTMLKVAEIYETYDREKAKKMLLDFDDLLVETYNLLSEKEHIREKYRDTFQHLLVDEYQDTNPIQNEILKLLMNTEGSFWICGDDWQSIFSFTGASVSNILKFKDHFPDSASFILNTNYRSTPQILKACQNLISRNVRKIEKTLKPHNKDGEEIIVLECSNEEDEARRIAVEIIELTQSKRFNPKEIAILYRCNYQSRLIEELLSDQKIPYHIENGQNFYMRTEVKILLDYLRVISNPNSPEADEALAAVINAPNRYVSRKIMDDFEAYAEVKCIHLYEAMKKKPILLPYIRKNIKDMIGFLDPLMEDAATMEPVDAIALIRSVLDIDGYVTEDKIPDPDDQKIANLNQLQMAASKFRDIKAFLAHTYTFNEKISDDKDGVALMTIHKAKGLEFPVVFLCGLVSGILPTKQGDIEEERRICFVGISRAMQLLYLSWFVSSMNGQQMKKSIFLDEILTPAA